MRPNRRRGEDVEMGGFSGLTEDNVSQHNLSTQNLRRYPPGNLNPLVHNFRSPIGASSRVFQLRSRLTRADLYGEAPTRLAFTQR